MKKRTLIILCAFLVLNVIARDIPCEDNTQPDVEIKAKEIAPGFEENPMKDKVIDFVENAAALVAEEGEVAF